MHNKVDIKPKKNNQRKNFNFSLNNPSFESNKLNNKTSVNSYNNSEIKIKLYEYKNKINELNLFIKKLKDDFENKKK